MMNPALGPDASLPQLLAARARAASDGRLVLDVIGGALVAIGAVARRPVGWFTIAGMAIGLAAFGAWGVVDRELGERANAQPPTAHRVLRALRATVAVLGFSSVASALFAGLGLALGTWIS